MPLQEDALLDDDHGCFEVTRHSRGGLELHALRRHDVAHDLPVHDHRGRADVSIDTAALTTMSVSLDSTSPRIFPLNMTVPEQV